MQQFREHLMKQNERLNELIKQADNILDFPEVGYEEFTDHILGICTECDCRVYKGEDHLLDDNSPIHVSCATVREFKDLGFFAIEEHDDCDDDNCGTHGKGE